MAMSLDTAIKFTAKLEGQGLDQLKRGLQGMAQQANRSSKDLDQLYNANKKLSQAAGQSINSLNRQVTVLTNLRNEAALGSRQFKFYSAELEKLQRQQAKLTGTTKGGGGLLAMGGGLGGLAVAAGGGLAVKYIADVGLESESAQVRLKALADEFGEYNQAQAAAARIAQTLRISTTEAQGSFASLYASLRPTGITIQELEKAFIGFSAAARNSGATAQETSNALIQLKQGLASGVLQGEELRSIREQAPLAAQAIAKELGVSIGELKNLAAEGKVTTDVVLRALGKLQDTQLGKLNAQFQTGAQALADLQNELRRTGEGIAKAFGPAAIVLLRGFTSALQRVSDALRLTEGSQEREADRIRATIQAQKEASKKFGIGGFFRYGFEIDRFQNQRAEELFAQFQAARRQQAMGAMGDNPSADQREAREAAAGEREAARQRARKEALEDELKIRKDAEEKLADAAQRNAEQIADFQRETIKRAMELERDLGDERLKIERQIADTRTKLQQTLEDRALEAERQRLAAAGLSTEGIETAKEVKEIFRRYDEQRIENERGAVDAQTDLQRRLEEFKISVAEGIGKLQEGYARQVSNILQDAGQKLAEKMKQGAEAAAATLGGATGSGTGAVGQVSANGPSIAQALMAGLGITKAQAAGIVGNLQRESGLNPRVNEGGFVGLPLGVGGYGLAQWTGGRQQALRRFAGYDDKKAGDLQTQVRFIIAELLGPENKALQKLRETVSPEQAAVVFDKYYERSGIKALDERKANARAVFTRLGSAAPMAPALPPATAPAMAGVTQAGASLSAAQGALAKQQQLVNEQQTVAALEQKYGAITDALSRQQEAAGNKLRDEVRYFELLKQGISPEIAKQRVELEGVAAIEKLKLEALQTELEARIATLPVESALRQELERQVAAIEDRLNLQGQIVDKTIALSEAERKANEQRERQQRTIDAVANSIGDGLSRAFDLLATGTDDWGASLKEIASGVLKDIAKQLFQIFVIEAAIKALKGFLRPGTDAAGNVAPNTFANGGIMTSSGPAPLKRYSQGGIANRPQLALYGEGSKPEAYVPLPDGRRIPVALQGQDKMRDAMGAGPTQGMGAPVLNMSFHSTNIGGVEYVSRDQLEAAMAETRRAASRDGAKRGMTMTLDKLQQSPSTRTRVGLR
jgi:tape measure domain-containing protein